VCVEGAIWECRVMVPSLRGSFKAANISGERYQTMERHNNRRLDPLGKMVLPSAVKRDLKLEPKTQVSLMPVDTIIIMRRLDGEPSAHCYTGEIDPLGRIEIPPELMHHLNWTADNELSLYSIDNLLILKSA